MIPLFRTWTFDGVRFLAITNRHDPRSVVIVDELHRNYGSWWTIERFRAEQRARGPLAVPLEGSCRLSVEVVRAPELVPTNYAGNPHE